jgi:2-keto-4-pentenoate hydratase/2-oxohepta-3-ene-1,7-dioic acid hydratase in catechol pathway
VFGYTLVVGWRSVPSAGSRMGAGTEPATEPTTDAARYAGASLGPCVVTPDEFDPACSTLTFAVGGRVTSRGGFDEAPRTFADLIAHLSSVQPLSAGEAIGSGTFPGGRGVDVGVQLLPSAVVAAAATGIGAFTVPLGRPGDTVSTSSRASRGSSRTRLRLLRAVPDLAARRA